MLKTLKSISLKGRASLFAMSLLASLGLTAGFMPNASAAWSDCVDGRVCFWVDTNGNGSMGWVPVSVTDCRVFVSPFVNSISSVWNRTYYPVRFYTADDCFDSFTGFYYTVSSGQQINFTSWPHANSFESMQINP